MESNIDIIYMYSDPLIQTFEGQIEKVNPVQHKHEY